MTGSKNGPLQYAGTDNNPPWPAYTYKTQAYAEEQVTKLARQLAGMRHLDGMLTTKEG